MYAFVTKRNIFKGNFTKCIYNLKFLVYNVKNGRKEGQVTVRWNLIKWEKDNGLKSYFVAQKIGVSRQTWSRIKTGKQAPTFEQLEKFKDVFHVDDVFALFKEE